MNDSDQALPPEQPLDPDAERQRLEELGEHIEEAAKHAAADLEIGGSGRTFTDSGVRAQVEEHGDTSHPPADR